MKMKKAILAKKIGMTQIFLEDGTGRDYTWQKILPRPKFVKL